MTVMRHVCLVCLTQLHAVFQVKRLREPQTQRPRE